MLYTDNDPFLGDFQRQRAEREKRKKQRQALLFAIILLFSSGFLNWLLEYPG